MWGLGTELRSSAGAVHAFNCWTISPAALKSFESLHLWTALFLRCSWGCGDSEGRAFNLVNNPLDSFYLGGTGFYILWKSVSKHHWVESYCLSLSLNVPVFMLGHGMMVAEFYLRGHHRERTNGPESFLNCGCHNPFSPLLRHKLAELNSSCLSLVEPRAMKSFNILLGTCFVQRYLGSPVYQPFSVCTSVGGLLMWKRLMFNCRPTHHNNSELWVGNPHLGGFPSRRRGRALFL